MHGHACAHTRARTHKHTYPHTHARPRAQAEGWDHRVTPSRRGERLIIKLAYTSTLSKLPAFHENLDRPTYIS